MVAATETGAGAPLTETEATVTGTVIATAMPAITVTRETAEIPVTREIRGITTATPVTRATTG